MPAGLRRRGEAAPDPEVSQVLSDDMSATPAVEPEIQEPVNEAQVPALRGTPLSDGEVADVAITSYGTSEFYSEDLGDDKKRKKVIQDVVRLCRGAPEMRRYVAYLRENLDMAKCSVLSGLTPEEQAQAGIELHHHPLTLYEVCELVMARMESESDRFTLFGVAHRVMAYHYRNKIGLVPLTKTMHQMAHDGQLRVDPRSVFGDWLGFLRDHDGYLTEELAAKVRAHLGGWEDGSSESANIRALKLSPQRWVAEHPQLADLMARADQIAAPTPEEREQMEETLDDAAEE